jgi:nicotinamide-nucleotide amidase
MDKPQMNAIILSVGDELILGQTVDTNSAWLSRQIAAVGIPILAHMTVPDDQHAIEEAISACVSKCDFLIVSGGIGPTQDDLTRQALAALMNAPLEEKSEWLAELHRFFESRGRQMPPINRIQAMIPRGAQMIFNTCGTAAGIRAQLNLNKLTYPTPGDVADAEYSNRDRCTVFITPGVPKEMKAMFTRDILPEMKKSAGGAVILSRTLHTFGLGESAIAEKLGTLMARERNPSVGTTVANGIVSLRLNARFPSLSEAQREIDKTETACRKALGDLIFGVDDQTLQQVLAKLLNRDGDAREIIQAVTTAESCTGGLIAKMLTDVAGTSKFFKQAFVTYSNESKTEALGVPAAMIEAHGAVSEEVVRAMAKGAMARAEAAYAMAVSGIAGPDGGTPEKPVGTVWIALAHPDGVDARVFLFSGDREMIRDRSAKTALTMLRFKLLEKELPF